MKKFWSIVLFSVSQVIALSPATTAQEKPSEPPMVVLAKSSGDIFYDERTKKNRREYKPKFTEVDISQYAAGELYAELTLGAGACNAALITTVTPSEDSSGGLAHFTVGQGKTVTSRISYSIRDGLFTYFDHKINKHSQSSKFHITVNHPTRGIMMWYAKDCEGTYEITVYIKNGKKLCGKLPPIPPALSHEIAALSKAKTYKERSRIYDLIHQELQKRGIGIGFFKAASAVTSDFSFNPRKFEPPAQDFLDNLSAELAVINAKYAVELLQTGKLAREEPNSYFLPYFSELRAIDNELVRREQMFAEKKLAAHSQSREIINSINERTNSRLTQNALTGMVFDSASATNEVINRKRKRNPQAGFDYGDIKDRKAVGEILTAKYWNNFLPNAILCR